MAVLDRATGEHAARRRRARTTVALAGPAFVASVAYVDPGNFATNFTAGAQHGYALVWVVVAANLMAILVQYLSSKVGIATGMSLPELCRERFGRRTNRALWVQAEVVAMATDLAEFVGCALGLHLIFGMPLLTAGLVTAAAVFAILPLQQRGSRPFERAIVLLLLLVAAGIGYLVLVAGPQDRSALAGGLVPSLGAGTLGLAVGIVGATVMPHVVYLHSALQRDRVRERPGQSRAAMLRASRWDCVVGLGAAGVLNLMMLCFAAVVFSGAGPAGGEIQLEAVPAVLTTVLGGGAALAFGVALIASGLSSATVGTYAGQVVMEGFVRRRISLLLRRSLTMAPSLLVLGLAVSPGQALVVSQIVLSFGIPFALVPLLLVSRDRAVMGEMVNRRRTTVAMVLVTGLISALNLYLLLSTAIGVLG